MINIDRNIRDTTSTRECSELLKLYNNYYDLLNECRCKVNECFAKWKRHDSTTLQNIINGLDIESVMSNSVISLYLDELLFELKDSIRALI